MSRSGTAFGAVGAGGAVSGGNMAQPTCRTGTNSDAAVRCTLLATAASWRRLVGRFANPRQIVGGFAAICWSVLGRLFGVRQQVHRSPITLTLNPLLLPCEYRTGGAMDHFWGNAGFLISGAGIAYSLWRQRRDGGYTQSKPTAKPKPKQSFNDWASESRRKVYQARRSKNPPGRL